MSGTKTKSKLPPSPDTPIADLSRTERDRTNQRRAELIERKIEGSLRVEEAAELENLQERWSAYLNVVAPLPWDKLAELEAYVAAEKASGQSGAA